MPSGGRTRLAPDERRRARIGAALGVFSAEAYDMVRMDAIAARAGCSKALLYHYFPTKREMFLAVMLDSHEKMLARTLPPEDDPARDRLRAGVRAFVAFAVEQQEAFRAVVRFGATDPDVRAVVEEGRHEQAGRILAGLPELFPVTPAVVLLVDAWTGFVPQLLDAWLERGTDVPEDEMVELCVRTLTAALRGWWESTQTGP